MEEMDAETRRQYLAEFDAQHRRETMHFLSTLTQKSSVADLQAEVEELTQGVTGLFEPLVASYFVSGLRPEIRRRLLCTCPCPTTREEAFTLARACEARVEKMPEIILPTRQSIILSPLQPSIDQPSIHSIVSPSVPSPDPFPSPKISTQPPLANSSPEPPDSPDLSFFPNPVIPPIHQSSEPPNQFPPLCLSSDPFSLSNPSPDPSIYSPFNQFPTIQSLPLDAPQKPIIFSGSLFPIPPSSSDSFPLSKPPPEPPDPDPFVKKEDKSGPEPDLNPKRTKELKNIQEGRINRISRIPPSSILNANSSTASAGKRGPANLFDWRYATLDCYENVRRVVKGDWNALVLGETPHSFPSTVEAGRSRRGWVMMAKRKNDAGNWFLESMKMQGIEFNVITNTMLLSGWVKVRRIDHANEVFDEMHHKTNVSFALMKSVKFRGEAPHKFQGVVEAVMKLRKDPKDDSQYLPPLVIGVENGIPTESNLDGDTFVTFNNHADRMVLFTKALEYEDFVKFDRVWAPKIHYAGMLQYAGELKFSSLYFVSPSETNRTIGEYIIHNGNTTVADSEEVEFGPVSLSWDGKWSNYFDASMAENIEVPSDSGITFNVQPKVKAAEEVFDEIPQSDSTSLLVSRGIEISPGQVMKYRFESNEFVGAALLDVYVKYGNVSNPYTVLTEVISPSLVSSHGMISAIGFTDLLEELQICKQLQACGSKLHLLHTAQNSLVAAFGNCRQADFAIKAFQETTSLNIISWGTMITSQGRARKSYPAASGFLSSTLNKCGHVLRK